MGDAPPPDTSARLEAEEALIREARQYIPEYGGHKLIYEEDLITRLADTLSARHSLEALPTERKWSEEQIIRACEALHVRTGHLASIENMRAALNAAGPPNE